MRTALFPGSFDPFTRGHADIVSRGLNIFDEVVIAVGHNVQKPGWIPVAERVRALSTFYASEPRIRVETYSGLTADYARQAGVTAILRGIRNIKDFEYENEIAQVNREIAGVETVFILADPQLNSLSSSIVRELFHFGHGILEYLPAGLNYECLLNS